MHPERSLPARFRIEERVAAGAYGTVFRAFDTATGTRVAIKQLHHEIEDPSAAQRFEREADILARVRSPHVVGFVDRGSPGDPWFALEWLDGEDLLRRMRRAPLDRRTALGVLPGGDPRTRARASALRCPLCVAIGLTSGGHTILGSSTRRCSIANPCRSARVSATRSR